MNLVKPSPQKIESEVLRPA